MQAYTYICTHMNVTYALPSYNSKYGVWIQSYSYMWCVLINKRAQALEHALRHRMSSRLCTERTPNTPHTHKHKTHFPYTLYCCASLTRSPRIMAVYACVSVCACLCGVCLLCARAHPARVHGAASKTLWRALASSRRHHAH